MRGQAGGGERRDGGRRPRRVASAADELRVLGLQPGEAVRWRPHSGSRWRSGVASHRERDGSIAVTDGRGAARSLPVDAIEVACAGRRGGANWEPLTERAARSEQLRLL